VHHEIEKVYRLVFKGSHLIGKVYISWENVLKSW